MKKTIITSAILSVLSFGVMAETPSFNFAEIGYISNLGGSEDFDGYELKGNFELNDNFYITAGFQSIDIDTFGFDVNGDIKMLGIGYKKDISTATAFYTELNYVDVKAGVSGFGSGSDSGYQFGFGVRSNVAENFEMKAGLNYLDVDGGDTFLELGAIYQLNNSTGIYFDVDTDFDDSKYGVGVRFSF